MPSSRSRKFQHIKSYPAVNHVDQPPVIERHVIALRGGPAGRGLRDEKPDLAWPQRVGHVDNAQPSAELDRMETMFPVRRSQNWCAPNRAPLVRLNGESSSLTWNWGRGSFWWIATCAIPPCPVTRLAPWALIVFGRERAG